ncbi:hypothetical protein GCM10010440_36380 [Kitasatospora cinereorecta]
MHWTVTVSGARLAVDPEPSDWGNTAVYRDGVGTMRSRRLTRELPYERLFVPHAATCPPGPASRDLRTCDPVLKRR